jgi:aspartyl-tRNA(Asn)/glutamyl-tRNA(Gln) amidotransferase subunit B
MNGKVKWEIVIGLETHAQLSTASKIFSGASTAFGAAPNSQASAVDIALPGVLPVLNKGAVERAIRFGLAVGGTINKRSVFARKNYFYPDLPKGYQISQYEIPVVQGGSIAIVSPTRGAIKVALTRAHLEEDAGKSLHEGLDSHGALGRGMTGIDLNRAGTPLLEIVSEPEMRGAEEAVAYAKTLHSLVMWIGICDGNMQEGSFRCDANVSVRLAGETQLGTRCEIKNLNSFRFIQQAIEFEVHRQIEIIEDGGKVVQETRLYDSDRNETRSMRSKEDAQDYRYFPDPDLPPLVISEQWIGQIQSEMPDLPSKVQAEFTETFGLSPYEAGLLCRDWETVHYFRNVAKQSGDPRLCAKWMIGELFGALNRAGLEIEQSPLWVNEFADLMKNLKDETLSSNSAKDVFHELWSTGNGKPPSQGITGAGARDQSSFGVATVAHIIAAKGLTQISDIGAIEKIVDDVLAANVAIVAEYKAGKEKAFNALVGKAMAATKGKANPTQVNAILKRKLAG